MTAGQTSLNALGAHPGASRALVTAGQTSLNAWDAGTGASCCCSQHANRVASPEEISLFGMYEFAGRCGIWVVVSWGFWVFFFFLGVGGGGFLG